VFVLEPAGRARIVPVKVGGRNATEAWLQEGPGPGTTVLVYPPATLGDGTRVQVRKVR
jgi:HlyD family secretion protein